MVLSRTLLLSRGMSSRTLVLKKGKPGPATKVPCCVLATAACSTASAAPRPVNSSSDESTSPPSTRSTTHSYRSPQHHYEAMAASFILAAKQAKLDLQRLGQAVPELLHTIDAYTAMVLQEASRKLKVSPAILDTPDASGAKQRLATTCLLALNLDNCASGLKWTALHPAMGVPLLQQFMQMGRADAFAGPVYLQQPQQPFELDVAGYHRLSTQRPQFVGRFLEKYWDDAVVADQHPFPVMAVKELAQDVLSVSVVEAVLGGCAAGRQLLSTASELGLSRSNSTTAVESSPSSLNASWWDMVASHPCAVLGVLLLSRPKMPLGEFLHRIGCSNSCSGFEHTAAPAANSVRWSGAFELCAEPSGVKGTGGWGRGHITAVGASGEEGVSGRALLMVQPREQEATLPAAHSSLAINSSTASILGWAGKVGGVVGRLLGLRPNKCQ